MDNNVDFSDIPALGDTQGLENFINNQNLQAQGLTPVQPTTEQPAPAAQPTAQPAAPAAQPNPAQPAQPAPAAQPAPTFTKEQVAAIIAQADALRAQQGGGNGVQQPTQPQQPRQAFQYTDQERNFVINAMQRGYSLDQINQVIMQRRGQNGMVQGNPALEQRMSQLETYIKQQEYNAAETAFINKLSDFGDKFGISEKDLITFGNASLSKGINIAMPNVDLETVFKAVYPEQYAIRIQRMSPTNTSQIYGGTSIPEGNRALASKAEDAYVEAFLKQTMPNQYGMLNKK